MIKTIFFGTSEFGLPALDWLKSQTDLVAVISTPDRPSGRKQELVPSPVKAWAVQNNVLLLQPEKLKDNEEFHKALIGLEPDMAVVASYGKIIPSAILEIPRYGSVNLHPSLLPKYRGSSPIQAAILNGDTLTGTTLMLLDAEMDHGPIIAQAKFPLSENYYYPELQQELAQLSVRVLAENLNQYISGQLEPVPQPHEEATYTSLLKKEDGLLDWSVSAEQIDRKIRALNPWPGTYTPVKVISDDKSELAILKIFSVEILDSRELSPGEFSLNSGLRIGTGTHDLNILELQLSGGRKLPVKDFLSGLQNRRLEVQS